MFWIWIYSNIGDFMSLEYISSVVAIVALIALIFKEVVHWRERKDFNTWYRNRELDWDRERNSWALKFFAKTAKDAEDLFKVEMERLELQKTNMENQSQHLKYINNLGGNQDLIAEAKSREEALKKKIEKKLKERENIVADA